jgi:signal transduction histidine kinase
MDVIKRLLMAIILLLFSISLFSQSITIGFTRFAPVAFEDENGNLVGFYVELIEEIVNNSDYSDKVSFVYNENFSEIYRQVLNNEVDLFAALIRNPAREDLFYWPEYSVTTNYSALFVGQNSGFNQIEDLIGQPIGFVINEASQEEFSRLMESFSIEYKPVFFNTFDSMAEALNSGAIYGFVSYSLFSPDLLIQNRIVQSTLAFSPLSAYITGSVDISQEVKDFTDFLSQRISELRSDKDSMYWNIYNKYYGENIVFSIPVWVYFAIVSLFITIVFSAVIIQILTRRIRKYNDELEQKVEERTVELKIASEMLIDAEKRNTVSMLVAGVAHEINTPVGVVLTSSSFIESAIIELKKKFDENELMKSDFEKFFQGAHDSFQIINYNINRASELIQNFKNISSNQFTDEKQLININKYINQIVSSISPQFKNTDISLNVDCEDFELETYPDVISAIVINVVINGLQHGFNYGKKSGYIDVLCKKEDDSCIITISNDGDIIPEKDMDKIFQPFYTTKRMSGNSGIGLNIVYNTIKDKLESDIDVENSDEKDDIYNKISNLIKPL